MLLAQCQLSPLVFYICVCVLYLRGFLMEWLFSMSRTNSDKQEHVSSTVLLLQLNLFFSILLLLPFSLIFFIFRGKHK
ncbi:hypothetical protein BX070DRAFT_230213 [Coemansia spiralis]|nr:hypothetical protein BX070DRAFT_230213 [Coemansia spiralis]